MGKLTLILGGARSGKSSYAERLAAQHPGPVTYIATAQALDEEMTMRIAAHRAQRPPGWQTVELPVGAGAWLADHPPQSGLVLLDCITLLISNILLQSAGDVDHPDEKATSAQVEDEITRLLAAIGGTEHRGGIEHRTSSPSEWVIVSNEVGLGLVPPYPVGRLYRDLLGRANQRLALRAERVIFMIAGLPMVLAGVEAPAEAGAEASTGAPP